MKGNAFNFKITSPTTVMVVLVIGVLGTIILYLQQAQYALRAQSVYDEDSVGQNENKIVTQDEPNNTETGESNKPPTPIPSPAATNASSNTYPQQNSSSATVVAGQQDVKTNPQSEVGGIEAVNELFSGEDLGRQEDIEPKKDNKLTLTIVITGLVIGCLLAGMILLAKKSKSDEN